MRLWPCAQEECPILREDRVAHTLSTRSSATSIFAVLSPGFALCRCTRSVRFDDLVAVGEALARVLAANPEVLLLTTSDLNHYENDANYAAKG